MKIPPLIFFKFCLAGLLPVTFIQLATAQARNINLGKKPVTPVEYSIQLDVISKGFDNKTAWFLPRAGVIPGKVPEVVLTMQKWLMGGSDVFLPVNDMRTTDFGKTWTEPVEHSTTLGRRSESGNIEVAVIDLSPKWHQKSGKILATAHSVRYRDNEIVTGISNAPAWTVYDASTRTWSDWKTLMLPDKDKFFSVGAGADQRVDLKNGDILWPVYYKPKDASSFIATVLRCKFDGKNLTYVEHGTELTVPNGRGFAEPSLAKFRDKYYLTLRNNDSGYVAVSKNGLHYEKPKTWRFDDGQDLGSYNTQQHWVTHSDGLFLVYTRRGANNDHVFRHRAPLFIAQVDPERMVVIRSTERILAPNKGARMGNFGVVNVNENETWVTTAEGMSQGGQEYGADNHVYVARILWNKKNKTWNKY